VNIKLPGRVLRGSKYLSSLFDRQRQLGIVLWVLKLNMEVRIPRVIPLLQFTAG
jgi:hypothetical protein